MQTAVRRETEHDESRRGPGRSESHRLPAHGAPGLRGRRRDLLEATSGSGGTGVGPAAASGALLGAFADELAERIACAVAERLATLVERPPSPALLDRRGLAEALAVGVDTVDKLRREGLPELRVGDAPRFRLEAVLAWLGQRSEAR